MAYRYQIELTREWPVKVEGKTATVVAPPIKASLLVAFASGGIE